MRSLTLLCPDGTIASILEIPEHAMPEQHAKIILGASTLCVARGWTLDTGTERHMPRVTDRLRDVCACLSGRPCDVSHGAGCPCRTCRTADLLTTIEAHDPDRDVRDVASAVYGDVPWLSDTGRDPWPLGPTTTDPDTLACCPVCGCTGCQAHPQERCSARIRYWRDVTTCLLPASHAGPCVGHAPRNGTVVSGPEASHA